VDRVAGQTAEMSMDVRLADSCFMAPSATGKNDVRLGAGIAFG